MKRILAFINLGACALNCAPKPAETAVSFDEVVATRRSVRSYDAAKSVSEAQVDKLTDRIEEATAADVDLDGAIDDLDKAGARREREDDSFEDVLAAFGDDLPETPAAEPPDSAPAGETPSAASPIADS